MCGRFTLTTSPDELQAAFDWLKMPPEMTDAQGGGPLPRYNIAPTQPVAVVPNDGFNRLDYFTWGLVPSWAKDPNIGSRMINARAETLAEKPSFRNAFKRRRCLILADGFYEWQVIPRQKSKQPMYITLEDHRPFAFGGLWEIWKSPDGSEIYSCTIITTEPNPLMATIHNRMPLILPPETYTQWLNPNEQRPEALKSLLEPYPASQMAAYPVSSLVNSPANDTPELVEPLRGAI